MSENRALLVVNPIQRPKGGKRLIGIVNILERLGVHCALKFTEHKGHGMELASRGVAEGYRTIVAVGGDGTVNEVVNGVAGSEAAVFSIPLGAGNDFLRRVRIWTWEEACRVLAEGHFTHVDMRLAEYQDDAGQRKQRYYAVLADAGFGSEVVHNTPRRFRHALGGGIGYVVSLYRAAVRGQSRARRMKVREVEVEADRSTRVGVDGEVMGYAPARFCVVPGGLKTVCPPETASSQVAKGI